MSGSADLPRGTLRRALSGSAESVAPRLLNAILATDGPDGRVAVRLTEVEAYGGADDPGSHAHRGPTRRNASMFGPPGHLYVYFTYGMHHCANVVVGPETDPGAVLLRAGEIVEGTALARRRRTGSTDRDLARGPARLCRALGLDGADDGADLAGPRVVLTLASASPETVARGPRVGLRAAPERPWRFWIDGDPTVSAYRPAARRSR